MSSPTVPTVPTAAVAAVDEGETTYVSPSTDRPTAID